MAVPFTIDFTAPNAPTNVNAAPVTLLRAPEADAVQITWTPVSTAPENLVRQELWMNDGVDWTRIAYWTDPAVASYTYPFPRSGKNILYQLNQIVRSGSNTLTGLWGSDTAQVNLAHLSLVSVKAPQTRRVSIRAWPSQRRTFTQNQDWHYPAGGTNPIELPGSLRGRDWSLSGQLYDREDGVTAEQTMEDFVTLFDTYDIFCLRDPRGSKDFCRFNGNPTDNFGKGGVRHELDFQVRKVAYVEGA
jgi:hypothetical protein